MPAAPSIAIAAAAQENILVERKVMRVALSSLFAREVPGLVIRCQSGRIHLPEMDLSCRSAASTCVWVRSCQPTIQL
jgi:hypothetical protein